jgi:ABC-2 type transport system ATP-binding protein
MTVGVRAKDLRKVYAATPMPGAAGVRPKGNSSSKPGKEQIVALDNLSLEINPGEIFGLLGPNGAGKSTTLGILTTRIRPTSGEAWIGECDVWRQKVAAKRLIGVVQQRPNLDFLLTAREILLFHAAYFGIAAKERIRRAAQLLEIFRLTDRAHDLVNKFSFGMQQRLSIARAMMHEPQVLFLDEPSTGLDPQTRLMLWDILRDYKARGKTVVITTHNMEEADTLCDSVAIVDHGKLIAFGTPPELKSSVPGGYLLRLRFVGVPNGITRELETVPGIRSVSVRGQHTDIYADRGGSLVPAILAIAAANRVDVCDVHISEPSLENFFIHHTGRSLRD